MSKAMELADKLELMERSGLWYASKDAAAELRRLAAVEEELAAIRALEPTPPEGMKLVGYYHKAPSGDRFEDDFFFADAINGDCPDCHPVYADENLIVAPSSIYALPEQK